MSRAPKPIDPAASARHRFGFTLRQLRSRAGHSLQGFARRVGKSDSYLSAVELAEARCTRAFAGDCERLLDAPGELLPLWEQADREWDRKSNGHYRTPLQRERRLRGWTLQEVVDRLERLSWELDRRELGVSVNTVSRWERGVIPVPGPPYLRLLPILYGKPVSELFPALHKPVARVAERPVLPEEVERALDAIFAGLEAICHAGPAELRMIRRQFVHVLETVSASAGNGHARAS